MKHTLLDLENRIHKLQQRDPVGNARLIAKIKRKIKMIENKEGAE